MGQHFWLTVSYLKTDMGVIYKRYPTRRMTSSEVSHHFKVADPIPNIRKFSPVLSEKLEGVGQGEILVTAMAIPEVRPFAGEVQHALDKNILFDFLKDECNLVPDEDGILVSTNGTNPKEGIVDSTATAGS